MFDFKHFNGNMVNIPGLISKDPQMWLNNPDK